MIEWGLISQSPAICEATEIKCFTFAVHSGQCSGRSQVLYHAMPPEGPYDSFLNAKYLAKEQSVPSFKSWSDPNQGSNPQPPT